MGAPSARLVFSDQSRYASHMAALLSEQKNGTFLMYLLVDNTNQILGRANLSITTTKADLGYRVAQSHAGKGIATAAVQQVCALAKTRHSIAKITAQAAQLNGETIWLESYHKRL